MPVIFGCHAWSRSTALLRWRTAVEQLRGFGRWHDQLMPPEHDAGLPVAITDGWPEPLAGCSLRMSETSIVLGELQLPGVRDLVRASAAVLTQRLDLPADPETWTDQRSGEVIKVVVPPTSPSVIPPSATTDADSFAGWLQSTHGTSGRLILCDAVPTWWIVHDQPLELALVCAPAHIIREFLVDTVRADDALGSWLPGIAQSDVLEVRRRYGL
jgi:hypothetical protein